ncbi:MAG: TerB family tellurite resistance protein [Paracoccaceae bacterium]
MLHRIFSRRPATPEPLPEPDEQLALGALLVRIAMADDVYTAEEIGQIDQILAKSYDLNRVAAARLRATCEKLEKHAPGTDEFARLIRQEVSYGDRLQIVSALWDVVLADGVRDDAEEDTLHLIETTLGIASDDSDAAKAVALQHT